MPRKTEYGKFILTAGEIGGYTVCPEAWRLATVNKVNRIRTDRAQRGNKLHAEWAQNYDEVVDLSRSIKIILLLIALSVLIFLLAN